MKDKKRPLSVESSHPHKKVYTIRIKKSIVENILFILEDIAGVVTVLLIFLIASFSGLL